MLNSSLVGRELPTGLPCGGTLTITSVHVEAGFDGLPTIICGLRWNTGRPDLDASPTVGSLAPGTALWTQLERAGAIQR